MMRQVDADEFFRIMGPLDVHPRVDSSTFREPWTISNWELRETRKVVGVSKSNGYGGHQYFVEEG